MLGKGWIVEVRYTSIVVESVEVTTEAACQPPCSLLNIHNWESGITGSFSVVVPEDTKGWDMSVTFNTAVR